MKIDHQKLAALGAPVRLRQLQDEQAAILKEFPGLAAPAQGRPGRRRMSAKARAEVSRRMKKYWAGRRKAQK